MENNIQAVKDRAKELVAEGNQRQVVLRSKSGESIFEVSLTVAVAIAAVLLVTGILSIPLLVIATVLAMIFGVRLELRNNAPQNDNTVLIES